MDQRTVSSVIAGRPVAGAPGGRIRSTNPARLDEVVADVALGDAALLVTAARAARDAQRAWADVPAPVRGRAIAHIGRLVEDNKQALAALPAEHRKALQEAAAALQVKMLREIPAREQSDLKTLETEHKVKLIQAKPEDVARAIVVLSHPDTHWITGNVIGVDGGEEIVG